MKRREFLKKAGTGAAAAVAATTVMAPAVIAKKTYRWKMVTTWPPKLPVLQTGAVRLAKRIEEGWVTEEQALKLAQDLMYNNPQTVYGGETL